MIEAVAVDAIIIANGDLEAIHDIVGCFIQPIPGLSQPVGQAPEEIGQAMPVAIEAAFWKHFRDELAACMN